MAHSPVQTGLPGMQVRTDRLPPHPHHPPPRAAPGRREGRAPRAGRDTQPRRRGERGMGSRRLSLRVGLGQGGTVCRGAVGVGKGAAWAEGAGREEAMPLGSDWARGLGWGGEGAGSRNPWKRNVLSALRVMPNEVPLPGGSFPPSLCLSFLE